MNDKHFGDLPFFAPCLQTHYLPIGHFLSSHLCTFIHPTPSTWTTLTSPMSANKYTHKHLENAYSFFNT